MVDYLGNHAYIAVMKYVPALVIAASDQVAPMVASAEGMLLLVEQPPGQWTIIGAITIAIGGLLIALEAQQSMTTVELSF